MPLQALAGYIPIHEAHSEGCTAEERWRNTVAAAFTEQRSRPGRARREARAPVT